MRSSHPSALAQQLPPPRNPAGNDTEWLLPGPDLVPPQNEPQQAAQNAPQVLPQNGPQQPPAAPPLGAQAVKKNPDQLSALYAARRRVQIERKQAQIDRMNQFKAARAAQEQKLYQDWHERYLADTPVRVEYYRAPGRLLSIATRNTVLHVDLLALLLRRRPGSNSSRRLRTSRLHASLLPTRLLRHILFVGMVGGGERRGVMSPGRARQLVTGGIVRSHELFFGQAQEMAPQLLFAWSY